MNWTMASASIVSARFQKMNFRGDCSRNTRYEITFEGSVLTTRERNYYDDSDFYAVVWDSAENCLRSVEYATTRYYTYDNHAWADATDEVKKSAGDWLEAHYADVLKEANVRQSKDVRKGKRVKVVRGRKVPRGTEGMVFWSKETRYPAWASFTELRIGIREDSGTVHWTYGKNCEVINPESYLKPDADIANMAKRYRTAYHMPFVAPDCVNLG